MTTTTSKEPLKAVLFDLDGTLIDSIDNIFACWQHTMRTLLGREITREEVLPMVGRTLFDSFEEVAPGRSAEMFAIYRAHQSITHDAMITLIPGTREALERLKASGLTLGVVTSKGIPAATSGLSLFNLAPFFDVLVTIESTVRHKPQPDPLLAACEQLAIAPSQAIYVGDAVVDILCGKAAGTQTAGVTWGAGALEDITRAQPDYIFNNMSELGVLCASTSIGRREN